MTVAEALQYAVGRHRAGFLAEAEAIYRQILARDPNHADALHYLAEINFRGGNLAAAKALIERAIALRPDDPHFHNMLGAALMSMGRADEAASALLRALKLDPKLVTAWTNLAHLRRGAGRLDEAIEIYTTALTLDARDAGARHGRALAFLDADRFDEAVAAFHAVIEIDPRSADAHYNLAVALVRMGQDEAAAAAAVAALSLQPELIPAHRLLPGLCRKLGRMDEAVAAFHAALQRLPNEPILWNDLSATLTDLGAERTEEAMASCRRALELQPNFPEAHFNLGNLFTRQERWEDAVASFQRALESFPDPLGAREVRADVYTNLAHALGKLDRPEEAISAGALAVELKPDDGVMHSNLGGFYIAGRRWEEAAQSCRRAIALKPDQTEAHNNLGIALKAMGELEAAVLCCREAIACAADPTEARCNLGLVSLLLGRYEEGWREFEARLALAPQVRKSPTPRWDGERIPGRTLLLQSEQGFGDTLQFARYAPLVRQRSGAARVIMECQPELARLLKRNPGLEAEIAVLASDAPSTTAVDFHIPLMSLPLALALFEPLPMAAPYLTADPGLRAEWRGRLRPRPGRRVGLAWAGNRWHKDDRTRSLPSAELLPLLRLPGINFYSLQVAVRPSDAALRQETGLIDWSIQLGDFAETAALAAELDLIISVDTAVAHLAGAMGRPVWTLLPSVPDWRWGMEREATAWYPSMRLFRQPARGDWSAVLRRVADELSSWSTGRDRT